MTNHKPEPRFSVMIVEDQAMMRVFLERWVAALPGFFVAGVSRSGEEALLRVDALKPDVALVDFQLPGMDGLAFVRAARQMRPQMRALVVTSLMDALTLTRVRESGVEGYLEKDAPPELLADALTAVVAGRRFYSETFKQTLAREGARAQGAGKILSRREQQVLGHVLDGKANKEIAELMGLSQRTVEYHRLNLMTKLGASNLIELMTHAKSLGWR